MPTDKHALEMTAEKVNEGYEASYTPLFPILTKTKKYEEVIGEVKLESSSIIGDAKARKINAQDTEFKHAKSAPKSKQFNKYLSAIKYTVSGFVDNSDFQSRGNELIDVNMMEFDKNVFLGDPTDSGALRNNGLWMSNDPDYITKLIKSMLANPTQDEWKDLFDAIIYESEQKVGNVAKNIVLVGDAATKLGRFVPNTTTTYLRAIQNAYSDTGRQITIDTAPSNLTEGTTESGILLLTPSKIVHRYTAIPHIRKNGYNDEDEYTWMSLFYGSSMVDVEKAGAIIKQPIQFT